MCRKGAMIVAFVHLSVAYIANNSRTRRPSVPKFRMKVPHHWCDSNTGFRVKRSKIKVTRPINADTRRAPYFPNSKAYELQTWYTDGGRRPASATGDMTSKVKVTRLRDQSEPSWPNAVIVSLEVGGGIPCQPNQAATLVVVVINFAAVICSLVSSRAPQEMCVKIQSSAVDSDRVSQTAADRINFSCTRRAVGTRRAVSRISISLSCVEDLQLSSSEPFNRNIKTAEHRTII